MTGSPSPRVVAAVLARSSSPNRPGGLLSDRALVPILGRPALAHLVRRLGLCRNLQAVVLAVGDVRADGHILRAAAGLGLPSVAGHPHDVLRRLLLAAESEGADHVARVNGNFPLLDPWALDELVAGHLRAEADYSSNSHYQGLVYGLGAEVMAVGALRKALEYGRPGDAHSGARLFLRRPRDFSLHLPPAAQTAPDLKACVDFSGDEKIIEAIFEAHPEPDNAQVIAFFAAHPDLSASGGRGGAAEVGLSKMLLFPEKLSALKDNGPDRRDLSYPVTVELSLTNRCNQNCLWCSDRDLRARSPDALTLAGLKALFADLADGGARGVTIEGGGEPTLSPFFAEAAAEALGHGLAVGLITNGLDLFGPGCDADIYKRFEWIRVSLDAADRRQYLRTKGVDGFDRVLANLARLAELCRESTLGVGYVLTNQNDEPDHLQDLALTLRSLGLNYLQVRPVVDHPELVSRLPLDFLKKFAAPDFSVNLTALTDNAAGGNLGLPCLAHSLSVVIGADGAVWLCGRLNADASARPLGRLADHGFRQIWHGPERARQAALAASPQFCLDHCPPCRMTKYNQLLAEIDKLKTRNFI